MITKFLRKNQDNFQLNSDIFKLNYLPPILLLGSLGSWIFSLNNIPIRQMGPFGLITVLPITWFVACVLLIVSFVLALQQKPLNNKLLLSQIVLLILILYGTNSIIQELPRFIVTYRHAGIIDYIVRQNEIDPNIDAYFNWPGFFILNALLTELSHFNHPLEYIPWVMSAFWNLMYLGPILLILKWAINDNRIVWLGTWFFFLNNWVGQDYFAPQSFAFLLYLIVIAILLNWFSVIPNKPITYNFFEHLMLVPYILRLFNGQANSPHPVESNNRIKLKISIILLFSAIVASHQLTPFFCLISITGLVILKRITTRTLLILLIIIQLSWLFFLAYPYMQGHLGGLLTDATQTLSGGAVRDNVNDRIRGSYEHNIIVRIRIFSTLLVWVTSVIGMFLRWKAKQNDLSMIILAFAPLIILPLQSYGGEMLLRVFMFSCVPMVFFTASLFQKLFSLRCSGLITVIFCLVSFLFLSIFLFTRYGNEYMDYTTLDEKAALDYIYDHSTKETIIFLAAPNTIISYRNYEINRIFSLLNLTKQSDNKFDLDLTLRVMEGDLTELESDLLKVRRPVKFDKSFLIITRMQEAYLDLFYDIRPDELKKFENKLVASDKVTIIFNNRDARIYQLKNIDKNDRKAR